ncbi:pH-response regulator protein palA/RIM20 [Candida viswanathii]|uniref:pH-response regulator protein palA/RIM20 n=1 Tax=Candida viswanathii TaxID=5486 RepID=A0A367YE30_9ASCO|nr:pH-response regulator protein palA/RIM20 [Candida viswanathii]
MNSNLLYIPLKQSRPIDLGHELKEVITKSYFQPPSAFESDLTFLTNLRNKVTGVTDIVEKTNNRDNEAILLEFFQVTSPIQSKFPDDCIEFAWYDTLAYGPRGPFPYRSFKIEKLNVVFQLGSLYSQMAILELRHTDLGLKKACQYYQLSSGCFEFIANNLNAELEADKNPVILQIPKSFQIETIQCLKFLMLAQAQETIWQKAINNATMKDSVISRLSFQTSEFYAQALVYGNSSDLIKLEWINHMKVKRFHFLAAAHFRSGTVAADAAQYGDQVAHLRAASVAVDQALKSKKYVNSLVLEDLQGLTDVIKTRLRTAEKDNDLVYLKIVPQQNELKPIVGVSMVKSLQPEQLTSKISEHQVFEDLLPYIIINVAQAMRERQDDYIITRFHQPIQSLNNMFTKFLNERGLPASIDSIQQPENIPDSIIQHSQEILKNGGLQFIEKSFKEIQSLNFECNHLLQECKTRINLDRNEDQMLRDRQGTARWSRASTDEAASELITKTEKMKQYLEQAKNGDGLVHNKYTDIKPILEVYSGGFESLSKYIPNSQYIALPESLSAVINELRDCLSQATTIETERRDFIHNLEIKSRDNNILPKLVEEYNSHRADVYNDQGDFKPNCFEPVYERHLKLFDSDLKYVTETKDSQVNLEHKIDAINNKFIREFNNVKNASQEKRQTKLQILEDGYEKFLQIVVNLNEGSKFYSDFIEKGTNVLRQCEEYLYKRRIESRDLELAINNSFQAVPEDPKELHLEVPGTNENDHNLISPRTSKPGLWNPNSDIKFG